VLGWCSVFDLTLARWGKFYGAAAKDFYERNDFFARGSNLFQTSWGFPHLIGNTGLVSRSGMHEGLGFCSMVKSMAFMDEIVKINFFSRCFLLESVSNGGRPVSLGMLFWIVYSVTFLSFSVAKYLTDTMVRTIQ